MVQAAGMDDGKTKTVKRCEICTFEFDPQLVDPPAPVTPAKFVPSFRNYRLIGLACDQWMAMRGISWYSWRDQIAYQFKHWHD